MKKGQRRYNQAHYEALGDVSHVLLHAENVCSLNNNFSFLIGDHRESVRVAGNKRKFEEAIFTSESDTFKVGNIKFSLIRTLSKENTS